MNEMDERDELVAVLAGHQHAKFAFGNHYGRLFDCECGDRFYDNPAAHQADAILAAGYTKPRTITTVEELDALPVGTVIRTLGDEDRFDPRVAVKDAMWRTESEWYVADSDDSVLDSDELDDLPATVLYEPPA